MALIGEMQYLTIGENTYSIPTSGGSTVTIERALTSGTKSATINVDGTSYDLYAPTPNAGTVTSVRVQATSPVQSSTSTAQSSTLNTTISLANGYGDTKNPYASKTKNYVLAAPATENGVPSFRALVAADIPDLSDTYLTSSDITDKADKFVVHIGEQISGDYYQIDKTYQQIVSAAFTGSQLIAIDMDITYPYLGVAIMGGAPVIGFGFSATYNGTAILNGYVILENDTAMRINSNTTIPTKVSQLTNDRGYVTSDEKMKWTASTSSNTYYPLQSTSTATTSTASTLNGVNFYQYYNTAGGYRRLNLGNATAYNSSGGAYGTIRLYGAAATYYGDLVPGTLGTTSGDGHISANRTWTLPDKTGTVALTSDIPAAPTATESATTGITASTTATKTTLGTASSIYGVGSTTTTASKASGGNGTAPSWVFEEVSIPNVTAAGSASTWTFEEKTIPNVTAAGSASTWTFGATTVGDGTLVGTVDSSDSSMLVITAGTKSVQQKTGGGNGTAPTLGTAIKVQSKSGGGNGTAPTIGTAIKVQSKKSGSNGSASTWSFTDVTVPIKDSSATSVPNISVASATVSITDPGHTHTI